MWNFDPTAEQADYDQVPGLRQAWSRFLSDSYESTLYGRQKEDALGELSLWGKTRADLRFYNPLTMPVPAGSVPDNVNWQALPTSYDPQFGGDEDALLSYLDERQHDPSNNIVTRMQDEYCEWRVVRDDAGNIKKIIFTSEPPEYYQFLWDDPYHVGASQTRDLLVALYRERTGNASITLADLMDASGQYDWYNRWNNDYCVHMQQPNNTLGAEINIAARSCILRKSNRGKGTLIKDAQQLIDCAQYGNSQRQSDPNIGAAVNLFARENRFVTLQNPVGLYMTGLDTTGWTAPDGRDPQSFWNVIKGVADTDATRAMIVRAEYSVPDSLVYTVSDIKIGGLNIKYGGHIAAHIQMRLGVLKSAPAALPPPNAIGCYSDQTQNLPMSSLTLRRVR
jgi:hypothetical protein